MRRVLITDDFSAAGIAIFKDGHCQVTVEPSITAVQLAACLDQYDALVVRSRITVDAALLAAAPGLKVIGRVGVGLDNVDSAAAARYGIAVVNAPTANVCSTAEFTLAMLLALARHIPQAHDSLKAGHWHRAAFCGVEICGKTLGIIGCGSIGQEVARRARLFGMTIVVYDPFLAPACYAVADTVCRDIEQLYQQADFITIHTPLTSATRRLIDAAALARMKRGVRLINCARGGIVDEAALASAIRHGQVAGAALDVFEEEPPVYRDLIALPQVIVSPHLGAATREAQERSAVEVAQRVCAALARVCAAAEPLD